MKVRIVCFALLLLAWPAVAQQVPPSAADQLRRAAEQNGALQPHLAKLSSRLRQAMDRVLESRATRRTGTVREVQHALGPHDLNLDDSGRVSVVLRVIAITQDRLDQLAALEFQQTASTRDLPVSANHQTLAGWAYFDRLEAMAQVHGIFEIRAAVEPITQLGAISTEGDEIHGVRDTRLYLGVDGAGQSVGVISTGVDHLADSQALGELPFTVDVLSNARGCIARGTDCGCEDGSFNCDVRDEGTAMLEIVHDLAPGANLLFSDNGNDRVAFANHIVALANRGSAVIVDDIGWFTAPVYEDGIIAQTVDSVVNNRNVVYVSSAGNGTNRSRFHAAGFADADTDGWHEFSPGDEFLNIEIPVEGTISAWLQWNNRYGTASDDYNLYLYNEDASQILRLSDSQQNGTGDPIESLFYFNPTRNPIKVAIAVNRFTGQARHLTLFLSWRRGTSPDIEAHPATNSVTVWGHAAARESLAVGAINAGDSNLAIASYSSLGPSRIYDYGADGRPLGFTARDKPDLAGIDNVSITGVGGFGSTRCEPGVAVCFRGTSAAAPHVAAIAALVRARKPSAGALEIRQILSETAIDLGSPGRDLVYGDGLVDALASVKRACADCATVPTRLFNISTNGPITASGMQAGFIVTGNIAKRFIVLGEKLNSGIDPVLSVTNLAGDIVYDSNDDWQSHPTSGEVSADLRSPADSADAGFAVTLDPGTYVARMSSGNAASGSGIVAINDIDVAAGAAELFNLSTNGVVDSLGLFAGFIVKEDAGNAQRFIVLAERFNSAIDPTLRVTNLAGDLVFDSNDNWRAHPTAGEVQARLRAPGSELDAAFAITLPPGTYVARMQSRNGQTGTGIVAINNVSAP